MNDPAKTIHETHESIRTRDYDYFKAAIANGYLSVADQQNKKAAIISGRSLDLIHEGARAIHEFLAERRSASAAPKP